MNGNLHNTGETLLEVRNLRTYFYTLDRVVKAVDGVSFRVNRRQTVGIVGESGSGKTVTALSILRLVPEPPGRIIEGNIFFHNTDILALSRKKDLRKIRGNKISMIFQEPMSSLNPVYTIGNQIAEVLRVHRNMSRREAMQEAVRLLDLVKIPSPEQRAREYPHQLSGGMQQRAMIAMALACEPDLLIADEPTTALDVTVQAQILELLQELQQKFQTAILMITHNFGIIAEISDTVLVMYAGMIVEQATTTELYENPLHPYTKLLLRSLPNLEKVTEDTKLPTIEGTVPDPSDFPSGCRFHPRCPIMSEECTAEIPDLIDVSNKHFVRCFHWNKL